MAQEGHQSGGDTGVYVAAVLFVGVIYAAQYFAPDIRRYQSLFLAPQAQAIAWVGQLPVIGQGFAWLSGNTPETLSLMASYLQLDGGAMKPGVLHEVTRTVGRYVSFLTLPIVAAFFLFWYQREAHYSVRVKDTKDMHRRIATRHPELRGMDLTARDMFRGQYRAPDSVHYFALTQKILDADGNLDKDKARRVFQRQLGDRFTDYSVLRSDPVLGWVANHIIDAIPRKYRKKALKDAKTYHAYNITVVLRLLEMGRKMGLLPSSRYRALREQNRGYWLAISSAGRRVVYAEAVGIIGQYHWEMEVRRESLARKELLSAGLCDMAQVADDYQAALIETPKDTPWELDQDLWENYDPTR